MKENHQPQTEVEEGDVCLCPLEGIIEVISRKWALQVIAAIGNNGRLRYTGLLGEIRGISPRTLAYRLKEMEKAGLLERQAFAEIPPRVEYSLTPDGEELREAMKPLMMWAGSRDVEIGGGSPCLSSTSSRESR